MNLCTPTDVTAFLPGLTLDLPGQPELTTATLNTWIAEISTRIRSAAAALGLAIPPSMPDPVTGAWLICESITAESVAAVVLSQRTLAGAIDPIVQKQAMVAREAAAHRYALLATGRLSPAWTESIPAIALCTRDAIARYVPGWVIDAIHMPNDDTVDRWILQQSAVVAAAGRMLGYPITGLTTSQAIAYADLVARQVGAWALRARTIAQSGAQIDPQVNDLLHTAADDLEGFATASLYGWVF